MRQADSGAERGSIAVVIVAAGRGERAGIADGPKQYREIGGVSILRQSIEAFVAHQRIRQIVVVIHPDDGLLFEKAVGVIDTNTPILVVSGGATRQISTLRGLQALQEANPDIVLIHDGVRPFVDHPTIDRILEAVSRENGVLPGMPVSDTLKRVGAHGLIVETVTRAGLFAAQTPQAFPFARILEAHVRAGQSGHADFTDDAAIAEWDGLPVRVVTGDAANIKLTWAKDIEMANDRSSRDTVRYPDVRTGSGYDVHAFEPGDHVTLCGVDIPHTRKLSGHSDADVGLHALTDALLATCGAGDIGTHFPPSDEKWRGAASHTFVEYAAAVVRQNGGRIANADVTLICEAPRIGPHREAMTNALVSMLGIDAQRISIKATTNEQLGFIGRQEGIAAIATATVVFPGELS